MMPVVIGTRKGYQRRGYQVTRTNPDEPGRTRTNPDEPGRTRANPDEPGQPSAVNRHIGLGDEDDVASHFANARASRKQRV